VRQWSYTADAIPLVCLDPLLDKTWEVEGAKKDEFASESIIYNRRTILQEKLRRWEEKRKSAVSAGYRLRYRYNWSIPIPILIPIVLLMVSIP
jgi:hypothetical protein